MTEKLYYADSYTDFFDAAVTACEQTGSGWRATLNRTAFYPEGGGQPADNGTLGGARVLDVQEKDGDIWHYIDKPLETGVVVEGRVDFERRFDLMQQHSGEHIVSGIVHKLYGFDNIGFHMGAEVITIDFSGELTEAELLNVEKLANDGVFSNAPITCACYSPEEAGAFEYRSKKKLTGIIRLVSVKGYDVCACCGTHVKHTGEIGLIKLLSCQHYKGGSRITMVCGRRALADYNKKEASNTAISISLSAKPENTAEAVEHLKNEAAALKYALVALEDRLFEAKAELIKTSGGYVCAFENGLSGDGARRFSLLLSQKAGVTAGVFNGSDEAGWKYAISSKAGDVRALNTAMLKALGGKGGGKPELVQGSTGAAREKIKEMWRCYFETQE